MFLALNALQPGRHGAPVSAADAPVSAAGLSARGEMRRPERSEGASIALQSPVGLARGASNDRVRTNTGTSLAQRPNGRGAAGRFFFLCRFGTRLTAPALVFSLGFSLTFSLALSRFSFPALSSVVLTKEDFFLDANAEPHSLFILCCLRFQLSKSQQFTRFYLLNRKQPLHRASPMQPLASGWRGCVAPT